MSRYATIRTIDGGLFDKASILAVGPCGTGLDFHVSYEHGRVWLCQEEISEIVYDACGNCGRAIVEDGYPVGGESWHLECALSQDPHA